MCVFVINNQSYLSGTHGINNTIESFHGGTEPLLILHQSDQTCNNLQEREIPRLCKHVTIHIYIFYIKSGCFLLHIMFAIVS